MTQSTSISTNRDMTGPELDAYFARILNERTPLDVASLPTEELQARLAVLEPQFTDGPNLLDCWTAIGNLHSSDREAVNRGAMFAMQLTVARAFDKAGAR